MKIKNRGRYLKNKRSPGGLIIIGTSGHARIVYDTFNLALSKKYNLIGFITSDAISSFSGYRVLGGEADVRELSKKYRIKNAFIAIGSGFHRERITENLLSKNKIKAINIIHPSAIIQNNVEMGTGNFIGPGAIINSHAHIGSHCLINTGVIIEHDCYIDDFVTVSPGVSLGGGVRVGKRSFIGIGADIIHKQIIENDVVIGAGATVISNIKANSVAIGCPGRIIKKRKADDAYL